MPRKKAPAPNALSRALSAEIRAQLGRRKVDQKDIAAKMTRGEDYLSRRLRDLGSFDLTDLDEICAALGVNMIELMQRALSAAEAEQVAEAEKKLRRRRRRTGEDGSQNGRSGS